MTQVFGHRHGETAGTPFQNQSNPIFNFREINETGLDQRCCDQGCRYQEVLDFCGRTKYDQL